MIKKTTYLLLLVIALNACNDSDKEAAAGTDVKLKTMIKPFSDTVKADTFQVKLSGKSPREAELIFSIRSHEGKEIYKEEIKAKDLFNNYDATIDLKKEKNQVKFLNEEINRFFEEENFMEPAITDDETPDQHVPDKIFYSELKASQLNGFIYRLGKENKVYIAWSQKEKKVKTYYNCCE